MVRAALLSSSLWACSKAPARPVVAPAPERPYEAPALGLDAPRADRYAADFLSMWAFVEDRHCCLASLPVDWAAVRDAYGPIAAGQPDDLGLFKTLERAMDALLDPNSQLETELPSSYRRAPHDIWAELREGVPLVVDVAPSSSAERQAVRPGQRVLTIDGVPVDAAIDARIAQGVRTDDAMARAWALRSALNGAAARVREMELQTPEGSRRFATIKEDAPPPAVQTRRTGAVGEISVRSLDSAALDAVREAHAGLGSAGALIWDLRANAGGDPAAADALFAVIAQDPRPSALLVDHFSRNEAEALVVRLSALPQVTSVGTRMGRTVAQTVAHTLANTGYTFTVRTGPLEVEGRSLDTWEPEVVIDPSREPYRDRIREAAIALLSQAP